MRVVYINLQKNLFVVRKLSSMISGLRAIAKHRFLLIYLLENNIEVLNLLTKDGSSLPVLRKTGAGLLRKLEAKYVLRKAGLEKVKTITDPAELKQDDVVIYYVVNWTPQQLDSICTAPGVRVLEHQHFYGTKKFADPLKAMDFQYFMFDVDLRKYSKLYQKNFSWFKGDFIMRPYAFEPRFKVNKDFLQRKNKAVAMGTLTKSDDPEFIEAYGSEYYQPRRKMIMDNAGRYPDEIDSYISEYNETPLKEVKKDDGKLVRYYKKTVNFFQEGKQKKYFSFDMVEKYNDYKMFICPEDINGSYGIGTIEGMACGCAMIGVSYGAFEDIGMKAGEHYIAYDGTMEDLVAKIRRYQEPDRQDELRRIADAGCRFIHENFTEEIVAKRYLDDLKRISGTGSEMMRGEIDAGK